MELEQMKVLTRREKEVIAELSKGLYYKEIACKIFISQETVKKHVKSIYRKMGVRNRVEATMKYVNQLSREDEPTN